MELVSTGGTAKALREAGLTVRDISELTGFPEMLDGRVKTLHPKVHGGILHMRGNAEHVAAVEAHGIEPIDMVVVNLYAFEKTARSPAWRFRDVIENIDIGGPSMVRSAAKNFEDVAIVTSVADYGAMAEELAANGGALSRATRWRLAKAAFAVTAAYDAGIATALESIAEPRRMGAGGVRGGSDAAGGADDRSAEDVLRYGENPHQKAALYVDGSGKGVAAAKQLQGKELSYNNIVDLDACWELVSEFDAAAEAAVAIIKHTNPCGASTGATVLEAYKRALEADPVSAFGGSDRDQPRGGRRGGGGDCQAVCGGDCGSGVHEGGAGAVCGEEEPAAGGDCGGRGWRRGEAGRVIKQVSGGFLMQDADRLRVAEAELKVVTEREPTPEEMRALLFAWSVCKHVKSNAIVYARYADGHGQTVGIGAGQMSRVDAAQVWRDEGGASAGGDGGGVGRVFPVPGWAGDGGGGGCDGGDPAGRVGAGRRGDCGGEPAGRGDGVYRGTPFPARMRAGDGQEPWPAAYNWEIWLRMRGLFAAPHPMEATASSKQQCLCP